MKCNQIVKGITRAVAAGLFARSQRVQRPTPQKLASQTYLQRKFPLEQLEMQSSHTILENDCELTQKVNRRHQMTNIVFYKLRQLSTSNSLNSEFSKFVCGYRLLLEVLQRSLTNLAFDSCCLSDASMLLCYINCSLGDERSPSSKSSDHSNHTRR
jgi:hypothetical protein